MSIDLSKVTDSDRAKVLEFTKKVRRSDNDLSKVPSSAVKGKRRSRK